MGYLLDKMTESKGKPVAAPSPTQPRKLAPKLEPSIPGRDQERTGRSEVQAELREQEAQARRDASPNPGMHPDRQLGLGFDGQAPIARIGRPKVWEEKVAPEHAINAATDRNSGARVQMGELDPKAAENQGTQYRADDVGPGIETAPEMSTEEKVADKAALIFGGSLGQGVVKAATDAETWTDPNLGRIAHTVAAPTLRNLMGIRDLNGRLAQGRRWAVDNPEDDTDDPVIQYTTPEGNTRTSKDLKDYYDLGDGKPRTVEQMEYQPNFRTADALDPLKKVTQKDMMPGRQYVKTDDGQIWQVPPGYSGKKIVTSKATGVPYALPDVFDENQLVWDDKGQGYLNKEMLLADGSTMAQEKILGQKPTYLGRGFDDGTFVRDGKGNPTAYGANADTKQIQNPNLNKFVASANMGIRDPRGPWQDTTGRNMWDKGYDSKKSAWREVIPYSADMTLGSAPYFVPGYGVAAGVADALPYALGYNGDTYNPKGRGFEHLDQLGEGSFEAGDMNRAQQFGGVGSAIANALLERVSGPAIGGAESLLPKAVKESAFGLKVAKSAESGVGKYAYPLLSSAITEGPIEEGPNAFVDRLKADGLQHYGQTQDWNTELGEYTYRQDESPMKRFFNVLGDAGQASAGGTLLGVGMGATKMVPGMAVDAAGFAIDKFGAPRPKNVLEPSPLTPGVGSSLEIQYPSSVKAPKKR